nr:NADH dehydrogenase subunit 4 [Nemalecium lighti]
MDLTIFLCLISIINLSFIKKNNINKIKLISIVWLILLWVIFIIIILTSDYSSNYNNPKVISMTNPSILNFNQLFISYDCISLCMIGLSIFLVITCLIKSWNSTNIMLKEFIILHHITLLVLILVFLVSDLLVFYFLFESTLIPLFIMIGVWGYRKEKIKAAYYFFFYTFIGSLFMLLAIFKLYYNYGTTNIISLLCINIDQETQITLFLGLTIALAVKIPMFPVHIWLPQAHVEAPINGSVLLAGILLKLGGYGFIRFLIPTCKTILINLSPVLIMFSILAIIITAMTTCRQNDIKKLIAYSSVSHMGLVTIGIFTQSLEGLISSILLMIAHGLVSSSLFFLAYILYKRFKTRNIKYFKGLISSLPVFSSLFLIIILGNIGFPGTINFISEFLILLSLQNLNYKIIIISCIGPFLTTIYSLMLYNKISFGFSSSYLKKGRDITKNEFLILFLFIIFIIGFGINPNFIVKKILFNSTYLFI